MRSYRDRIRKTWPLTEGDKKTGIGTSVEVQWLRLCAPSAGGVSSVPDQGAKIPQAEWQKKKKKILLLPNKCLAE